VRLKERRVSTAGLRAFLLGSIDGETGSDCAALVFLAISHPHVFRFFWLGVVSDRLSALWIFRIQCRGGSTLIRLRSYTLKLSGFEKKVIFDFSIQG
jgi:hypothetical protein